MARSFPKDCVRGRVRRLGLLGSGGQLHTGEVRASSGRIAESSSHFFLATVFFLKSTLKKKSQLVENGQTWSMVGYSDSCGVEMCRSLEGTRGFHIFLPRRALRWGSQSSQCAPAACGRKPAGACW